MDLRTAILGLLSWKPSAGYDLKRIISDSDIFYWSGNNNQIYKSLIELQKEGLLTHQIQLQDGLPAKKIYSITEKGRAELLLGLRTAPQAPELHKNFLVQLAWADMLPNEEILALLSSYEDEIATRLHMAQSQATRPGSRPDRSERERYLWRRIAQNLVSAYQTELDWVRQTKDELGQEKYSG